MQGGYMKYEYHKVIKSKWFIAFFLFLLFVNGSVSYHMCISSPNGYHLSEIKEYYDSKEHLESELSNLKSKIDSIRFDTDEEIKEYINLKIMITKKEEVLQLREII